MRLLRLYIGDYYVLHSLRIDFDPFGRVQEPDRPYNLDFLVGVNGSGKSTVLRALAEIFQGLRAEQQTINFQFEIEYWLEQPQTRIAVRNFLPDSDEVLNGFLVTKTSSLTGELPAYNPEELIDALNVEDLPTRVVAYTTGAEDDWLSANVKSRFNVSDMEVLEGRSLSKLALNELPAGRLETAPINQPTSQTFRLIPKQNLSLVALCGLLVNASYADEQQRPLNRVFIESNFEGVPGFSLNFNIANATAVQRQDIQNRLATYALRKIRNGGKVRLVFDLVALASKLKEEFGSGLELYEFLSDLAARSDQRPSVLTGVSLFIERQSENGLKPPLHTWDWLSDGERSFLGRMCLFLLFGDTDALILLDEPEVHFNDYWKRHIVGLLHNILTQKEPGSQKVCHLLIATHSSIALTDVHSDDILLLVREDMKTSGKSHSPSFQTFGADPSDIMVHVFGTKFANGERSVNYIRERIAKSTREELLKLQKEVAPGYWHYRIQLEIDQFGEVQVR